MTALDRRGPAPDRDSRPWWDAIARHEIELQRCGSCGAWRWPPRALCNRCASYETTWVRAAGTGTIASWIVNHHQFGPWLPTPYVVVTVRLDEQPDLLVPGSYEGMAEELATGLPVTAVFVDLPVEPGSEAGLDTAPTVLAWRRADDR